MLRLIRCLQKRKSCRIYRQGCKSKMNVFKPSFSKVWHILCTFYDDFCSCKQTFCEIKGYLKCCWVLRDDIVWIISYRGFSLKFYIYLKILKKMFSFSRMPLKHSIHSLRIAMILANRNLCDSVLPYTLLLSSAKLDQRKMKAFEDRNIL